MSFNHIILLSSAESILILSRAKDIIIIFKKTSQRTEEESLRIHRGLKRSLILEIVLFTPISATLIALITPVSAINERFPNLNITNIYTMLGIISYGFPWRVIRGIITKVALNTLEEFSKNLEEREANELSKKRLKERTKKYDD